MPGRDANERRLRWLLFAALVLCAVSIIASSYKIWQEWRLAEALVLYRTAIEAETVAAEGRVTWAKPETTDSGLLQEDLVATYPLIPTDGVMALAPWTIIQGSDGLFYFVFPDGQVSWTSCRTVGEARRAVEISREAVEPTEDTRSFRVIEESEQ